MKAIKYVLGVLLFVFGLLLISFAANGFETVIITSSIFAQYIGSPLAFLDAFTTLLKDPEYSIYLVSLFLGLFMCIYSGAVIRVFSTKRLIYGLIASLLLALLCTFVYLILLNISLWNSVLGFIGLLLFIGLILVSILFVISTHKHETFPYFGTNLLDKRIFYLLFCLAGLIFLPLINENLSILVLILMGVCGYVLAR